MLFEIIALVSTGAAGAPAQAQALWQDLRIGMTGEQVAAAYPSNVIQLTPECAARLSFKYGRDGGLTTVTLIAKPPALGGASVRATAVACSATVETSLATKYGEPQLVNVEQSRLIDLTTDVSGWVQDQINIVFRSQRERGINRRSPQWSVEYSGVPPRRVLPDVSDKL